MAAFMTPSPPRRRRPRRAPVTLLALLAALGLHLSFFAALLLLAWLGFFRSGEKPKAQSIQAVGLRTITAEQWAENRGDQPPNPNAPPAPAPSEIVKTEPEPEKKPDEVPKGQVVDTAPGNGETDPDAKYLAESNNKVKRETRAKDQTPFYRNAQPHRTTTTPQHGAGHDDREEKNGNNGLAEDDRPLRDSKEQKLAMEVPDIKAREEVKLQPEDSDTPGPQVANQSESAQVHGNSDRLRLQDGSPSAADEGSRGRTGKPGALNLLPSLSVLDNVSGAAPNDDLQDLDEGDGTYLNTREWKYASFFNRVKQSIGMNWDPGRELRERDPTGSIYGSRDRHTVLQVTLDERGRIKEVFVQKSCGLDFLDLEAIHSFERAQPFPNPPPGLLDRNQTVSFTFGFFVDMGGAPGLRMFRSP